MDPQLLRKVIIGVGLCTAFVLVFLLGRLSVSASRSPARAPQLAATDLPSPGVTPSPTYTEMLTSPPPPAPANDAPQPARRGRNQRGNPITVQMRVPNEPALALARDGLERARLGLNNTTTNNHGGYVELARADFALAAGDFANAITYFEQHPESISQPPELSPASERAITRIMAKEFPQPNNQNNPVLALSGMKSMAEGLRKAPGGTLDGNRDKAIANLERSFNNLSTAFDFLHTGGIPKADTTHIDLP